jgi:uncharacterized protein YfaS (alpha-2-macroglobulin family)
MTGLFSNRRTLCVALALALACELSACGPNAAPKPAGNRAHVASWKPGDEIEQRDASITLLFDREMVGIEAVGPALEPPPLHSQPDLPLQAHWENRKTLVVRPVAEWKSGQRYALVLDGELAARVAEPLRFVFDVQPLRASWLTAAGGNQDLEPKFDAVFTLPVAADAAAKACALVAFGGKRVALHAKPFAGDATNAAQAERMHFEVGERLALFTHYALDCTGLLPIAGTAPWRPDPNAQGFTTHGLPSLQRALPVDGAVSAPEQAELCLVMSTPIDLAELGRHVHVTPEPAGLAAGWHEGDCGQPADGVSPHYANSVLLAPRSAYQVTIDADLADAFGQKLGRAQQWSFRTTDRVPGLWSVTGFGSVLEYGRAGHAVGTLNLTQATLTCASLTPAQFASGFDQLSSWAFESNQVDARERAPAPWQALGLTARSHVLDAKAEPNAGRELPLNLGAQCGSGAGAPGLYVLELKPGASSVTTQGRQGDDPARLLANVTDLGVVAKRGESSALIWVTRLSNGALVANAAVDVIGANGRVLASSRTDARGLARFGKLPPAAESEFFAVRAGNDSAVVGTHWLWRDGLQPWQLGVREGDDESIRMFVHTDRGVYRPGERVFVHGLVRRISDTAPARVPADRHVSVTLSAGDETIFERKLELTEFGSFAVEIDLPAHVPPGSHSLRVEAAGKESYYPVEVAEFRPLTFEILAAPNHAEVLAPEVVQVDVDARYLSGQQLRAPALRWTVERSAAQISAPDFDEFSFGDNAPALPNEEPWPAGPSGILLQRDVKGAAMDDTHLSFATEAARSPTRYQITLEMTDAAQDRATRTFSVLAHSAERYAGVHMTRALIGEGEPVEAEVVLVDRAGKAVSGEADVELRHERWDCSDPLAACDAAVSVLEKQHVAIAAGKPAHVKFAAKQDGSVHVRAVTHDAAGRPSRASDSAWVWASAGAGPYNDRVAATLSVDRRSYRIGDRATLGLQTPLAPENLLVTSERSDVLFADVVSRSAGAPQIELGANAAPNAFVTLTGTTPRAQAGEAGRPRLVSGAHELRVQGPSRALQARITLARDKYEPGQRVEGDVDVTHLGKPVTAEVALVAVNESLLQLTGFDTPDPKAVFHAPRGLSVRTLSNIPRVVADPAKAAAVPQVARPGSAGEDGGGGRPDLRDDYVAAAYWAPALHTDAKGRVHFAFDAPSDLSAYRMMAVVAAKDDRVGSTDARFNVSKPVSAHPIVPRFVSRADQIEIGALVHDLSGTPGAVDVRFSAQGLQLGSTHAQVDADASGTPTFTQALVQDVDQARFEVEVHKGSDSDRVARTFVVRRPLDTEMRVLALQRGAQAKARLDWPAGIDRELSRLEITVDRAGLAPLAPVLVGLVNYPFGCTEQTAAALSALASAPELANAILPELSTTAKMRVHIADGVSRLLAARAGDGNFGLYPGMNGRVWLTALVLEAALAVRQAGFAVPELLTDGASSALSQWLASQNVHATSRAELELAAHSAWLLAQSGAPVDTLEDQIWQERSRLSFETNAYLLRLWALRGTHEDRRVELRALLRPASWLDRARDPELPLASPERTSALVLAALVADNHEPELQQKLATWLTERAADPGGYLSTREVADTLAALAGWARTRHAGGGQVKIGLGDAVLWQGVLSGAQVAAVNRPASAAPSGDVWVSADGDVSLSIRRRDVSPTAPKPPFAHGMSVVRRYLDPQTRKPLGVLGLGEVVQVELEVRLDRPMRMLALMDPMPGGLEPLDPGLSTGRVGGCDACNDNGGFDHVRRHDDHVEAFAEYVPVGTHILRYLLRATTPGAFSAPGASATLMYMPDYFARSGVGAMNVAQSVKR